MSCRYFLFSRGTHKNLQAEQAEEREEKEEEAAQKLLKEGRENHCYWRILFTCLLFTLLAIAMSTTSCEARANLCEAEIKALWAKLSDLEKGEVSEQQQACA